MPDPFHLQLSWLRVTHHAGSYDDVALSAALGFVMGVPILICECGLRVKAPGATPGRVGRCPNCGGPLKMPDVPAPVEVRRNRPREAAGPGYHMEPVEEASALVPSRSRQRPDVTPRAVFEQRKKSALTGDGFLPVLERPETNWFVSALYPLRGADSMGVIAATSAVLWFFTVLVPEYCLTLMGDAESMGVPTIGHLIALLSVLPFVILLPLVIFYWLQYLGRTLVSSAMGETRPPRSPDRNFDGFFNGMSPWLIWLMMGVCVGMLPLVCYASSRSAWTELNALAGLGYLLLGLPYILMAMLMAFLHDHALAANPWNVFGAMFRLGGSFALLCLFIAAIVALAGATVAGTFLLRASHMRVYIPVSLGAWIVVQWASVVVMRVLGIYYYPRRATLQWNHERPRWGVTWRL